MQDQRAKRAHQSNQRQPQQLTEAANLWHPKKSLTKEVFPVPDSSFFYLSGGVLHSGSIKHVFKIPLKFISISHKMCINNLGEFRDFW